MRTVCYHCGNFADGGDHPNSLRSEIARLQEQVETADADRERWYASSFAATKRAEAAEAERDRLREGLNKPTSAMIEDGALAYNLIGIAGGIINTAEDHVEFIWQAMSAALQKEPQP